jgi:hypothetical protein
VIWTVERHWGGLRNDGALYTLLAFNHLDPATFAGDLLVRYGSQDPFTIFPAIYAWAIATFGLTLANLGLLIIAYALWLAGAWSLSHRLARGWPAHLAFLAIAAAPLGYGAWQSFGAGENVLTPRPFAEGLTMLGLASLVARQWVRSAAAFVLAIVFHPAVALAGLSAAVLALAVRRRVIWIVIPAGAAAVLALAVAGVSPFAGLLNRIDDTWLTVIRTRTQYMFLSAWLAGDWARTISDAALCVAAAALSRGARRHAFLAVTATAILGIIVTGVGVDLLHNTLVTQLQTWRFAWLMAVVKWAAAAVVWLRLRRSNAGQVAACLLAAPAIILIRPFADQIWAWVPALAMSLGGLVLSFLVLRRRALEVSATARRLALEVMLVLPLASLGDGLISLWMDSLTWLRVREFAQDPTTFLPVRVGLALIGTGLVWLAARRPRTAMALGAAGLIAAASVFDFRAPWERYVMAAAPPLALPPAAEVIWDSEATPTWLLLRRPAWFSAMQASGLALSRGAGMEWVRRRRLMAPVMPLTDFRLDYKVAQCSDPVWRPKLSDVAEACRRAPALTGVIVDRPLSPTAEVAFDTRAPMTRMCGTWPRIGVRGTSRFYWLACDRLIASRR